MQLREQNSYFFGKDNYVHLNNLNFPYKLLIKDGKATSGYLIPLMTENTRTTGACRVKFVVARGWGQGTEIRNINHFEPLMGVTNSGRKNSTLCTKMVFWTHFLISCKIYNSNFGVTTRENV